MTTRKQQAALDRLIALIAEGVEYPEAEWKASKQGSLIDCSTLRDLYDAHLDAVEQERLDRQRYVAENTVTLHFSVQNGASA